jgi:hypothetical protein
MVSTPVTRPVTVTSFEVDSDQLVQQAGDDRPSSASRLWVSEPARASGLEEEPTLDEVQLDFTPFRLELLGARVEADHVEADASFEHQPDGPSHGGPQEATVVPSVVRALGLFASAFDTAARAVGAAALTGRLPPLSLASERHSPPSASSVRLASFWYGSVDVREPELRLSAPRVRADLFADTGPGKLLGNLLAEVARFLLGQNFGGLGALLGQLLNGMLTFARISLQSLKLLFIDVTSYLAALAASSGPGHGFAASGTVTVRASAWFQLALSLGSSGTGPDNVPSGGGPGRATAWGPMPSIGGSLGMGLDNAPSGGGPGRAAAWGPVPSSRGGSGAGPNTTSSGGGPVKASAWGLTSSGGGGAGAGQDADKPDPGSKQKEGDSSDEDSPLEDDNPLPRVLPEIGLREEGRPPVRQPEPEGEQSDGEGKLLTEPEQQENEVSLHTLQVTVVLIGARLEQWRADRATVVATERAGRTSRPARPKMRWLGGFPRG